MWYFIHLKIILCVNGASKLAIVVRWSLGPQSWDPGFESSAAAASLSKPIYIRLSSGPLVGWLVQMLTIASQAFIQYHITTIQIVWLLVSSLRSKWHSEIDSNKIKPAISVNWFAKYISVSYKFYLIYLLRIIRKESKTQNKSNIGRPFSISFIWFFFLSVFNLNFKTLY